MEKEVFEVEIVTPCFLGGSAGIGGMRAAEWRGASIRGELRWWFRAVAGALMSLEEVRAREQAIFGGTDQRSLLRVRPLNRVAPVTADWEVRKSARELAGLCGDPASEERLRLVGTRGEILSNPIHYLGFGPVDKGKIQRWYLPPGARVRFQLQWMGNVEKDLRELFARSFWAWLYLGGIGARSRKGFGSLQWIDEDGPADRAAFVEQIRSKIPPENGEAVLPEWTCFSSHSRIFIGQGMGSWQEAMTNLGAWLICFRRRYGYPQDGRTIAGRPVAGRDYEWAAPKGRRPRGGIPDKTAFGLPLPFKRKYKDTGREAGETVVWNSPDGDARRASPLLLHVAHIGNSYIPVLTYLPARFLPEVGRPVFEGHPDDSPEWERVDVVTHFLEELSTRGRIEEIRR
ncbi:MAG TPA: type III-B CRISPR module RAMP protein Cmr1 [Thermoanaerobaculia bacterium]